MCKAMPFFGVCLSRIGNISSHVAVSLFAASLGAEDQIRIIPFTLLGGAKQDMTACPAAKRIALKIILAPQTNV